MQFEPCPSCRGSGLQNGITGIESCYACRGQCEVPVRDQRGRFVAAVADQQAPTATDSQETEGR